MFDKDMRIVQTGNTVARVIPMVNNSDCKIIDILDAVSVSHIKTIKENDLTYSKNRQLFDVFFSK